MDHPTATITLKRGREKPVQNRHPWIFSGAIGKLQGQPEPGDLVIVTDSNGRFLAQAYYNPHSQIQARILTWDQDESIDEKFWHNKLAQAIEYRNRLQLESATTAYRLINAESDSLPGLIVDKYEEFLVIQCLTLGIDRRKDTLINLLVDVLRPKGIIERSDVSVRKKEGLEQVAGLCWGENPPDELIIQENGLRFGVDLLKGHKTGFYLDQRENRSIVCQPIFTQGKEILNVFSYSGGFAVYAALNGAERIINIDCSADVLIQAERNITLNSPERPGDEFIMGDAFEVLRYYRNNEQQFDMVILDPPKFAHSQRDVNRASRGYKDLNWLAIRLLKPGGTLATFSCSNHIHADLFQKIIFGASIDAGRNVQIIQQLGQAADHPILLTFPESAYLKGLLCRVF